MRRIEDRYSVSDVDFIPFVLDCRVTLLCLFHKLRDQLVSLVEVAVHQEYRELITADPEDRAVVERLTDQLAGVLQIEVALVMAESVVYGFEIVAVKDAYAEIEFFLIVYAFLKLVDIVGISTLVAHGSECVNICKPVEVLHLVLFFEDLLLGTDVVKEKDDDDKEDYRDHREDNEQVVLDDVTQVFLDVFSRIICERGMDNGIRDDAGYP